MPTRALIHSFVEAAPHIAWANRPDGSIEFINQKFKDYVGKSADEILTNPWETAVHPDDRELVLSLRRVSIAAVQPYWLECRLLRADGAVRWHSMHIAPLRGADGQLIAWYGSAMDTDDRKRTEEALRQSEARFRAVFESAAIGVARVGFETAEWLEVNDAFCRILGYGRGELIGRTWPEITHPDDIELDAVPFRRMAAGEIDEYSIEKRFLRKSGHAVWTRLTLSLVRDAKGAPEFEVCLVEDIHARKQAEEGLRRSNEDLERFAYVAGHDLQEPLRQVNFYSQLLERECGGQLDEQAKAYLQWITDGTHRMKSLVQNLLHMARASVPVEAETVDSAQLFQEVVGDLRSRIDESGAKITSSNLPVLVVPRSVLRQVFQNLLSNAVKYRDPDRGLAVRVECQQRGCEWLFSVQDNGQGIPVEYHDRIFTWFTRVPGVGASGSGIGLASAARALQKLNGRIWVTSEVGQGSTFYFVVPIASHDSLAM